jgi:hypothetical protein
VLLAAFGKLTPEDESEDETYDAKVKVLKEDVERHVKEEEGEIFPMRQIAWQRTLRDPCRSID